MTILAILIAGFSSVYPLGKSLEVTVKNDLGYERDTVQATHWHKVGNLWYVIKTDSTEIWVDNVKEIKK